MNVMEVHNVWPTKHGNNASFSSLRNEDKSDLFDNQMQFYDPSSQDATVDSDVSESSESEAAMSDSAQSNGLLQHLEDAEVVEFEMMNQV